MKYKRLILSSCILAVFFAYLFLRETSIQQKRLESPITATNSSFSTKSQQLQQAALPADASNEAPRSVIQTAPSYHNPTWRLIDSSNDGVIQRELYAIDDFKHNVLIEWNSSEQDGSNTDPIIANRLVLKISSSSSAYKLIKDAIPEVQKVRTHTLAEGQTALVIQFEAPKLEQIDAVYAALTRLGFNPSQIEHDYLVYSMSVNDPLANASGAWGQSYNNQWGYYHVKADKAIMAEGLTPAVVAVVDSGLDYNHPELAGRLWTNTHEIPGNGIDDDNNGFIDDVMGWDFYDDDNDPMDESGHGTAVSGVIAAQTNNHEGMAGAAPNALILPLRCLAPSGYGSSSDIAAAISFITLKHRVDVANFSIGTSSKASVVENAIDNSSLYTQTILIAATGNNGQYSIDQLPARNNHVLAVGSIGRSNLRSTFSTYGPRLDIVAPGENILSIRASHATTIGLISDTKYGQYTGTSMSTPFVSAAAAQIRYKNPSFSAADIRNTLLASAQDLGTLGRDDEYGSGLLDMEKALEVTTPMSGTLSYLGDIVSGTKQVILTTNYIPGSSANVRITSLDGSDLLTLFDGPVPSDGKISFSLGTSAFDNGAYRLVVTLIDTYGFEYVQIWEVIFSNISPQMLAEWNERDHFYRYSFPTLGDSNADGIPEVLYMGDTLLNWVDYTGAQPSGWPVTLDYDYAGPAAVGDLDGDGEAEVYLYIASTNAPAYVVGLDAKGKPLPGFPIQGSWSLGGENGNSVSTIFESTSPSIADINADGEDEVIFGLNSKVYAISRSGEALEGWPVSVSGATFVCTGSIADIDGDGYGDVTIRSTSGQVYVFDHMGNIMPGWPTKVGETGADAMSVTWADYDADAELELLCTEQGGTIALLDRQGNILRSVSGYKNVCPPAVADVTGDAKLEIAITTHEGVATLLDHTLHPLSGWPKTLSEAVQAPTLGDVDGNGSIDVIAMQGNAVVWAWDDEGNPLAVMGFPYGPNTAVGIYDYSPVTLCDLNQDGQLDLLYAGAWVEMRTVATAYTPSTLPYPTLFANEKRISRATPGITVTGISPQQIPSQAGVQVTLHGEGFLKGSVVTINGTPQDIIETTHNTLTFSCPSALPPALVDITVTNFNTGTSILEDSLLVHNTDSLAIYDLLEDSTESYNWNALGLPIPDGEVQITSTNTSLFPLNAITAGSTGLTLAPAADQTGYSLIEVSFNSGGMPEQAAFWIQVIPDNDAPYFDPIDDVELSVSQIGQPFITISGISAGPPNEATQYLALEATSSDPDVFADPEISYVQGRRTAYMELNPDVDFDGEVTIVVTLRDTALGGSGDSKSFSRSFRVIREIPLQIESVEPKRVSPGDTLTLQGTGFSLQVDENAVYMGKVRATIVSASSTELVVTVPNGAVTAPVTVQANRLSASAREWTRVVQPETLTLTSDGFSAPVILGQHQYWNSFGWLAFDLADADADGRVDIVDPIGDIYLSRSAKGSNPVAAFSKVALWSRYDYSDTYYNSYPRGVAAGDLNADNQVEVITADDHSLGYVRIYTNNNNDNTLIASDFASPISLTTSGGVLYGVDIGDINADGRNDFVNAQEANLELYFSDGGSDEILSGRYSNRLNFDLDRAYAKQPIITDLNLDGKGDVAVTITNGISGKYTYIYGNDADVGSLPTEDDFIKISYTTQSGYGFLEVADADGDGLPDIIRGKEILLNHWRGSWDSNTFQKIELPLTSDQHVAGQGDLDGDGLPDLIVRDNSTYDVIILRNESTPGTLSFKSVGVVDSAILYDVHVGDINADGMNDVIMSADDGSYKHMRVLLNLLNPSPILVAPDSVVVYAQGEATTFAIELRDNDTAADILNVAIESDNPELLPSDNIQMIGVGEKRQVIIHSTASQGGTANLKLSVSDHNKTTVKTIAVQIIEATEKLGLTLDSGITIPAGQVAKIPFALLPEGLDTDGLTLGAKSTNEGVIANSAITVKLNGDSPYLEVDGSQTVGSSIIELTVSKGLETTTAKVAVLVRDPQDTISIYIPPSLTTDNEGSFRIAIPFYTANGIDPATLLAALDLEGLQAWNKGDLTLRWEGTTLILEGRSSNAQAGTEVLPVRFGGTDLINDLFISITIPEINRAPVIGPIASQTLLEDSASRVLYPSISDDTTDIRHLSLTAYTPTPELISNALLRLYLENGNPKLEYGLVPDAFGEGEIVIVVSDGEKTTNLSIFIDIIPVNDAPTLVQPPDVIAYVNQPIQLPLEGISVGNHFEADSQELTVQVLSAQQGPLPFPLPGISWAEDQAQPTLIFDYQGDSLGIARLRVRVTDSGDISNGGARVTEKEFNLTVRSKPLVINSIEPTAAKPGDTLVINGDGFHPDPTMNTVRFGYMKSKVIDASENTLRCIVPTGSPSGRITVTTSGLLAKSVQAFTPTFGGTGEVRFSENQYIEFGQIENYGQAFMTDWNEDGKPDLVAIENRYYGTSGGFFWNAFQNQSSPSETSFSQPTRKRMLSGRYKQVDIDADGYLDWIGIFSDRYFSTITNYVSLIKHSGNVEGDFSTAYPTDGYLPDEDDLRDEHEYTSFLLDDFNADNTVDLLRSGSGTGTNFYANPGILHEGEVPVLRLSKAFDPTDPVYGDKAHADMDGDGRPDLISPHVPYPYNDADATTTLRLNTISEYNQNNLTFDDEVVIPGGAFSIFTHDINQDGKADIILGGGFPKVIINHSTPGNCNASRFTTVPLNYTTGHRDAGGNRVYGIMVFGDLNGDGLTDIVHRRYAFTYSRSSREKIEIYLNTSRGTTVSFADPIFITAPIHPIAITDVDGDSRPDIVGTFTRQVPDSTFNSYPRVYLNKSPLTSSTEPNETYEIRANSGIAWISEECIKPVLLANLDSGSISSSDISVLEASAITCNTSTERLEIDTSQTTPGTTVVSLVEATANVPETVTVQLKVLPESDQLILPVIEDQHCERSERVIRIPLQNVHIPQDMQPGCLYAQTDNYQPIGQFKWISSSLAVLEISASSLTQEVTKVIVRLESSTSDDSTNSTFRIIRPRTFFDHLKSQQSPWQSLDTRHEYSTSYILNNMVEDVMRFSFDGNATPKVDHNSKKVAITMRAPGASIDTHIWCSTDLKNWRVVDEPDLNIDYTNDGKRIYTIKPNLDQCVFFRVSFGGTE